MNLIQEEALRLIAVEIARLICVAEAAARTVRIAQENAADARMCYQSARTAAAEDAMLNASVGEYLAIDKLVDAEDAIKMGVAARVFVMTALVAEEKETSGTVLTASSRT